MDEEEVKAWHQEIRDWVEDVINDKYGSFVLGILSDLMHGFKNMKEELETYTKAKKEAIKKNRKILGLPEE